MSTFNDLKKSNNIAEKQTINGADLVAFTSNFGDQDLSGLANISLSNLNSTATDYLKTVCGAIPKTASGVGQVVYVNHYGSNNTALVAPSGGSWLILEIEEALDSTGAVYSYGADILHYAGELVAGGTTVVAARSGYYNRGGFWRIA